MKTVSLALRNLTRNKRRNAILAIAIAFGFFVVTVIDGLTTGMVNNLEHQITQLVGGNVIAQGLEWLPPQEEGGKAKIVNIVRDRDYIKNVVDDCKINYEYYSCFTMSNGMLIFGGNKSAIQLYGRDLTEKQLNESLQFVSGGVDLSKKNGLIISDKTADSMNLQVGDVVIYSTTTVYGQNTFADLTVTGILKSNSFVNTIQAYASIDDVNEILGLNLESDEMNTIGGWLLEEFGYLPNAGNVVIKDKNIYTVEEVEQRRISSVRIKKST